MTSPGLDARASMGGVRLIDLSHEITDGMTTYRGLPLERCAGLPAVVAAVGDREIGPEALPTGVEGCAVLLRSGWDRHWGTEHYDDPHHPHVGEAGARHLVEQGAVLVGIDPVNIDDTVGGHRPAHSVLLGAGVPVAEHLTRLDELPVRGARFTAVPPAVRGLATFPVRAFDDRTGQSGSGAA